MDAESDGDHRDEQHARSSSGLTLSLVLELDRGQSVTLTSKPTLVWQSPASCILGGAITRRYLRMANGPPPAGDELTNRGALIFRHDVVEFHLSGSAGRVLCEHNPYRRRPGEDEETEFGVATETQGLKCWMSASKPCKRCRRSSSGRGDLDHLETARVMPAAQQLHDVKPVDRGQGDVEGDHGPHSNGGIEDHK